MPLAQAVPSEIVVQLQDSGPNWVTIASLMVSALSPLVAIAVVFYAERNARERWRAEMKGTEQRWAEELAERSRNAEQDQARILSAEIRVVVSGALLQCDTVLLACQRHLDYPTAPAPPGGFRFAFEAESEPSMISVAPPAPSVSDAAIAQWAQDQSRWREGSRQAEVDAWLALAELRTSSGALSVLGQDHIASVLDELIEQAQDALSSRELPDPVQWLATRDRVVEAARSLVPLSVTAGAVGEPGGAAEPTDVRGSPTNVSSDSA